MSAKPSKRSANKPAASPQTATAAANAPTPNLSSAGAATIAAATPTAGEVSWLDSSDPKKRMWGKIIFTGVWIYVGALCLLALDQTFNWGIFGPKMPPLP